jgi:hypothetical protein
MHGDEMSIASLLDPSASFEGTERFLSGKRLVLPAPSNEEVIGLFEL